MIIGVNLSSEYFGEEALPLVRVEGEPVFEVFFGFDLDVFAVLLCSCFVGECAGVFSDAAVDAE